MLQKLFFYCKIYSLCVYRILHDLLVLENNMSITSHREIRRTLNIVITIIIIKYTYRGRETGISVRCEPLRPLTLC